MTDVPPSPPALRGDRYVLLVIGEGPVATHPLPDAGRVTIGRAPQNDVTIDDPSISRRHAVLHLGPAGVRVEDLGSANGTRVCGSKLFTQRSADLTDTAEILERRLAPGEALPIARDTVLRLGTVTLVVQARAEEEVAIPRAPSPPRPPPRHRPSEPALPPEFEKTLPIVRPTTPPADGSALRSGVEMVERDLIVRALDQCAGNQSRAAKLLGISRRTLVSRLEQYNLPRPRKGLNDR